MTDTSTWDTAHQEVSRTELQRAEIRGYADLFDAAPSGLAAELGIERADISGASCVRVDALPGHRLLNHALSPDASPPGPRELQSIVAFWHDRGLPALIASVERPPGLPRMDDLIRDYAWVKFTRDCSPTNHPASDLTIRALQHEHAERVGELLTDGFGLPARLGSWLGTLVGRRRWHWFGAFDADRLVAAGACFEDAGIGWLSLAATAPEDRGRGAQQALLAARIEHARAIGVRRLVTETGEAAEGRPDVSGRNIVRAGFKAVYTRPFWRSDPPEESASGR